MTTYVHLATLQVLCIAQGLDGTLLYPAQINSLQMTSNLHSNCEQLDISMTWRTIKLNFLRVSIAIHATYIVFNYCA